MEDIKVTRCTDCYSEFTEQETVGVCACPMCGSGSVPMAIAEDVMLPINWHELRILTIWSSNWADQMRGDRADQCRKTLHAILRRLVKHRPDGSAPLTLVAEIKELQKDYPGASLADSDGNIIVPPVTDPEEPPQPDPRGTREGVE